MYQNGLTTSDRLTSEFVRLVLVAVVCFYTAFSIEVVGLHAKGKTSRVYRSFRYKLTQSRCKIVSRTKRKERRIIYLPQMFFLFTRKLYLKWSKLLCKFTS